MYVADLAASLRGPRREKADLLAEARDSLVDAAEAYEEEGVDRVAAEHLAVTEFGPVRAIAAEYQRLLGVSQGRRTALVLFGVGAMQSIVSTYGWQSAGMGWTTDPGPTIHIVADVVDWLGIATKVFALLAFLACGIGVRYLGARTWMPRTIGLFALVSCLLGSILGGMLGLADPASWAFADVQHVVWFLAVGLLPPLWILSSARHSLVASAVRDR